MTDRTIARAVGVLFILASAAAIIGGSLLLPVHNRVAVAEIAAAQTQIVSGVLVELLLVFSVVGIAALLYPVLRRRDEGLALGYLGARMIEATLLLTAAVSGLLVYSRAPDVADVELLTDVREWNYTLGSMVAFSVGALILYAVLYRARLVPRWLSLWGLAGAALLLLRGVLQTYGWEPSAVLQGVFAAPIGINEMVVAGWLIVKGFDTHVPVVPETEPATTTSLSGR